jgi:hypothetical protein
MRTDGRTDMKPLVAFRNFLKAPKKIGNVRINEMRDVHVTVALKVVRITYSE